MISSIIIIMIRFIDLVFTIFSDARADVVVTGDTTLPYAFGEVYQLFDMRIQLTKRNGAKTCFLYAIPRVLENIVVQHAWIKWKPYFKLTMCVRTCNDVTFTLIIITAAAAIYLSIAYRNAIMRK